VTCHLSEVLIDLCMTRTRLSNADQINGTGDRSVEMVLGTEMEKYNYQKTKFQNGKQK
jgi:hypothetical protein